ncbi:hypothetical protein DLM78_04400 [Leptospira stimsonii]|uniref:Uncharacterized protein n=1 Tax=Leptospira stimsonii TaxID=2202203 RepID=A0A8B3CXH5_9LEPT|nr:hypothetical protein DLM78_04400 [Leptospira stimsonii]
MGRATFTEEPVGPTRVRGGGFYLQKVEFCDRGKSAEVFPPPLPSTQNQGGARDFHGRVRRSYKKSHSILVMDFRKIARAADLSTEV